MVEEGDWFKPVGVRGDECQSPRGAPPTKRIPIGESLWEARSPGLLLDGCTASPSLAAISLIGGLGDIDIAVECLEFHHCATPIDVCDDDTFHANFHTVSPYFATHHRLGWLNLDFEI